MKNYVQTFAVTACCAALQFFALPTCRLSATENGRVVDSVPLAAQPVALNPQRIEDGYLQGIVKAKRDSTLKPNAQGMITEIHVREGQWVEQGTPLVTVDNRAALAAVGIAQAQAKSRAAVDQAELAVKQAQSQLTRTRIAFQANASSEFEVESKQNQLDQAIATYNLRLEQQRQAAAELAFAQEQLKQRTLSAPFAGHVIKIHIGLGNSIDPSQVAVQVADLSELEVEMHLPLALFGRLVAGQQCTLQASAPVNRSLEAKVVHVAPVVEPTSGTFRVVLAIDNQGAQLPSGFEVRFVRADQ